MGQENRQFPVDAILGENPGRHQIDLRETCREALLYLAQQARRELEIFTHDLDPGLYDHSPFIEAVKQLALSSHRSRIRILLQDCGRVVRDGHRMVELARKLSSRIEVRRPHPDHQTIIENYLIADATGYMKLTYPGRYQGEVDFCDRLAANRLQETFDEMWEFGEPESALRRLYL